MDLILLKHTNTAAELRPHLYPSSFLNAVNLADFGIGTYIRHSHCYFSVFKSVVGIQKHY